jgi:hypothetical protein
MSLTSLCIGLPILSDFGERCYHVTVIWRVIWQCQCTHLQKLPDDSPHHPALNVLNLDSFAINAFLEAVKNE